MKYVLLIALSWFIVPMEQSIAQNLVPNGSFEEYDECPEPGGIHNAIGWMNPTAYSPDYFNACASDTIYGQSVPNNGFGFQNAKTGNGYAGLISMIETDGREYIQAALTDSLVAGVSYTVTFYVSVADSSPYVANNIGAYFSTIPILANDSWVLPYTPQMDNDPVINPLVDRYEWTEVSGDFLAQGGEKYITIGNFSNDLNTDTLFYSDGSEWLSFSYHYIDDVSVTETFPNSVDETNQTRITVYPNPSKGIVNIYSNTFIQSITVYSSVGQIVLDQSPKSYNFQVDLSEFSDVFYYVNMNTANSIVTKKIIINR